MTKPTKRGRPTTVDGGVRLDVRLPREDSARLDRAAAALNLTRSDLARQALTNHLDEIERNHMRKDTPARWVAFGPDAANPQHLPILAGDDLDDLRDAGDLFFDANQRQWEALPVGRVPTLATRGLLDANPFALIDGLVTAETRTSDLLRAATPLSMFTVETKSHRWKLEKGRWTQHMGVLRAVRAQDSRERRRFEWLFGWNERVGEPWLLVRPSDEDSAAAGIPQAVRKAIGEALTEWVAEQGAQAAT